MSRNRGQLIILSGPSGVGKTTIAEALIEREGFERVVTATTRSPRAGEIDGEDYHFLPRAEFESRIAAGRFLEHATVHDNLYGTPLDSVESGLADGKILLLNIDVQGARQIRERAASLGARSIFLLPPGLEELERRLRSRQTESEEELERRMETARDELAERDLYDHRVVNDSVERAVKEIRDLALTK